MSLPPAPPSRVSLPAFPIRMLSLASPVRRSSAEPPVAFSRWAMPPTTPVAVPVARFTVTDVVNRE
jgi:hypothetical protein